MKHNYKVHRVSRHPREITMTHPATGEQIPASVDSVELELVPHEHDGGSVVFRFIGEQAHEAALMFKHGSEVTLHLSVVDPIASEVN